MEFKSNVNADCCTPTGKYELCGCVSGVPYVQLTVVGGGTVQTAWLNTETGDTFTTKPTGFLTGTCSDAAAADVLKFSATAPTPTAPFAMPKDGYTTIVTDDGTEAGDIVSYWRYDAESGTWVEIPVVPVGGTEGQVLTSHADGTRTWEDPAVQAVMDNQVLTGGTGTNTTVTMTPTTVADESGGDQVNYTVTASVKIDGTTITEDPTTHVLSAANQKPDALTTAQPAPTATGNTTNLNTIFTDVNGVTWFVDFNGDAIQMSSPIFKERNRFYVDTNGVDTNPGANEAPFLTVQAAVAALGQGDVAVINEGTYTGTVNLSMQGANLAGAGGTTSVLTTIDALSVTTPFGFANQVSDLAVLGALTHSGNAILKLYSVTAGSLSHSGSAPLYINDTTISGNFVSTASGYEEINDSRLQDGTITKTVAGELYIKNSLIGNATFDTVDTIVVLDNVTIDVGDQVTIGAGVTYMLNDVRGTVIIDPAAVPFEAELQGIFTAAQCKSFETASFNDIRLTNVPEISAATKALVRDDNGVVSEQLFPSGIPTGGSEGQVLTVQPDGSYAWETPAGAPPAGQNVYFDAEDPASGTIFDTENPPVTNSNALKEDAANTYYGTDGSVWVWNGTAYVTKTYNFPTHHFLAVTTAAAGYATQTLPTVPIGKSYMTFSNRGIVHVTRNGVDISRSWTWVGAVGSYNSTLNYNATIDAGDLMQFAWESY